MILEALKRRVEEAPCDVVLASGGVDSTAVALAHRMLGLKPLLINVQYLEKPGDDLQYVVPVARRLGFPLLVRFVSKEEALEAVQEVVRILRVFNPMEVVNCAAVYVALREAKLRGAKRACTGDGGDELCVGYGYMLKMPLEELKDYMRRLPQTWSFCAFKIGEALGLDVASPFLQNVELLLSIPVEEKVKCGMGKCLLRAELAEALGRRWLGGRRAQWSGAAASTPYTTSWPRWARRSRPTYQPKARRGTYTTSSGNWATPISGPPRARAPSAASSSAAATAPCAGGSGGSCQIPRGYGGSAAKIYCLQLK